MTNAITAATVLAEIETLSEAKEIARDMRKTALAVEAKYGPDHSTAKMFSERYWDFIDEMTFKFSKAHTAA